jgi:hypothetical protein
MDNQIAIYRADTCTEILKANLIAANDDYSPTELAATLEAVTVIPGAKYFLQIDGSFGGAKGSYELYFYAYPVGMEEISENIQARPLLKVYPNPGRDIFNITAEGLVSSMVGFILYDMRGRTMLHESLPAIGGSCSTRMDLSGYASGIYQLLLLDGDRVVNRRIIRQ